MIQIPRIPRSSVLVLSAPVWLSACTGLPSAGDLAGRSGPPPLLATAGSLRPADAAVPPFPAGSVVRAPGLRPRGPAPVQLRPDHPQTYTVGPNDTVLQIAEVFLEEPGRWPEVWQPGPEGGNALYVGQVIELIEEGGRPRLQTRAPAPGEVVRLGPQARVTPLTPPIPTVLRRAIAGFLQQGTVANREDWETAPAIVGSYGDQTLLASGAHVYVNGLLDQYDQPRYRVFRPAAEYRDPVTGQVLGVNGVYIGEAILERLAEPAVLVLADLQVEANVGDRLLPVTAESEEYQFTLQPAPPHTEGQVIAVLGDAVMSGQYQSLVVNLGDQQGVKPGTLLAVYSRPREIGSFWQGTQQTLPGHRIGELMIYKVFDEVSYGLVTRFESQIMVADSVAGF